MKKLAFLIIPAIAGGLTVSAQKKTNGNIYIEHPAISVASAFEKAVVSGDSAKIAGFLTDDFKGINGTTTRLNNPTIDKKTYINNILPYSKRLDYFTIEPVPGSYPDAVEYQKDNKNGEVVVQNWILIKGVEKTSGVKIDAAAQRIYYITKDNKIKTIISYTNSTVIDEIFASLSNRTNGKIYNHHENINTVRLSVYALEKGDIEKSMSFYSPDARFSDINMDVDKTISLTEEKAFLQNFLKEFEIKSIDMVGYPDYLEYEMDNGRSVISWWKFNLIRKKDKKVIVMPMHISNEFDENGKITSEIAYYNETLLTK